MGKTKSSEGKKTPRLLQPPRALPTGRVHRSLVQGLRDDPHSLPLFEEDGEVGTREVFAQLFPTQPYKG